MASGDGVITRKDIITDEALSFGKEYRKNVDEAIQANDELIRQFKTLLDVSKAYRKAESNHDYKQEKAKEAQANRDILNSIKEMEQAERALERIRKEKLKTERELLKIAQENIRLSMSEAQRQAQAEKEIEKIKQERIKTEKELARLALENERLQKQQAQTAISNEKELERVKQELIKTEREATKLQQDKLRLDKLEADQKKRNTVLTMEERVQQQLANQADKQSVLSKMKLLEPYRALNAQRAIAKKKLQDLIATGTASNKQIRQAQREFDVLDKKVRKADSAVGDFTKNVGNYQSAIGNLTRELAGVFGWTSAIAGAVMLMRSFKDVIFDFDDGLLNVSKTTGIADQELKNLGVNIRLLSQELKVVPINKLLEYATVAGQLGVKGSDNIMKFTESLAKLETASNITGEEGGAEIARMLTLIDGGVHNVKAFGDEIVHLGNNFAATEKEILSNATSIAQNVSVYKTGRQEVLAFGTATKAVGIESELAGSKIGKAMKFLEASIRTGENISAVIQLTGMSVDELKVKFKEDSGGVLFKFIEGLNGIDKAGGSVIGTLNELGIKEERQERVLSSLATGGFETLKRAMYDVKDAAGAMTEEFETASSKLKNEVSKMEVAWDNFILAINTSDNSIGNFTRIFLNSITSMIEGITRLSDSWSAIWEQSYQKSYDFAQESAKLNYTDFDKFSNQRRKAMLDRQKFAKDEQNILKSILKDEQKLEELNKRNWASKTLDAGMAVDAVSLRIEESKKSLADVKGRIDTIDKMFADFKNRKKNNNKETTITGLTPEETEAERKKRETAEKKAQKEAEKREDERLKKLKESYEAEIDLKVWKADSLAEIYKAESINEKSTQDERYNALIASHKAEEESLKLNVEKQLTLSRSFQKDKTAFTEQEISDMLNNISLKSDITNEELLILEKYYAAQDKLRKGNQKSLEDNVKFEVEQVKKKIQEQVKSSNSKNFNDESGEINALSIGNNLTDVESYEKAVYEIKRKYLLKNLEDELAVYNQIIENEKAKGTVTQEMLDKQLELENSVRDFKNESHIISLEKAKEMEQRFIEMGENIKNALVDLTNAIFDNRIQRIDEDIERSNEYYEGQIEKYEGDAERQKLIREEQEQAREKLEAKKRKEQHKQAVFNKAMSVMDIGFSTAMAIMQGYAQLGPVAGSVAAVLIGILGTIQTAAVLATPIPKYKTGRKGGPEEYAIVGDGGVHEVIEHKDGSAELTPKRDTLVKLLEGDTVHASLDLYRKSRRNKINNDIYKDKLTLEAYHSMVVNDYSGLEKEILAMHETLKRKNMSPVVNVPKVDFAHQLWVEKQKNW